MRRASVEEEREQVVWGVNMTLHGALAGALLSECRDGVCQAQRAPPQRVASILRLGHACVCSQSVAAAICVVWSPEGACEGGVGGREDVDDSLDRSSPTLRFPKSAASLGLSKRVA